MHSNSEILINPEQTNVIVLDCPFCGGTDIYVGVAGASTYHVKCNTCGARTRPIDIDEATPYLEDLKKVSHQPDSAGYPLGQFQLDVFVVCAKLALDLWNKRSPINPECNPEPETDHDQF